KLIQKELGLASSIGADGATQASVNAGVDGKTLGNHPSFKDKWVFSIDKGSVQVREDIDFSLHVGADADMNNKIAVKIGALDTKGLGIQGLNVKDTTGAAATYAIDSIADAVARISAQRSLLGAVQNRLEHTINNLDNVVENTTAAESQIRDTDMATEMVKYSNNNVLAQAGQSMLAQSNQANQGVLSLLG
ncbi:MAG: flagellar hook protein, partial [Lachnospiraceae bacterium]|nr:flagellar hook protein [Lachnospiraceae bacterium]